MRTIARAVFVMSIGLISTGCILVADGQSRNYQPTVGRQLCDLKQAHDNGAINDDEYHSTKSKLLSNCR